MNFSRLPNNAQRPTPNAQRSTLELPNFRTSELPNSSLRRRRLRTGMTLIELVAALALFVIILGSLLTLMNSATALWSSSRSQQREQPTAQNIIDFLTDDLQQAVTDNGTPSNSVVKPTFLLDSRTDQAGNGVLILLQFARQTTSRTLTNTGTGVPLSLDAIFYTLFENALYRHVIPLSYSSFTDPKSLGELIDTARQGITSSSLHQTVRNFSTKGTATPTPPLPNWSCTLLAERIDGLRLLAVYPKRYMQSSWRLVSNEFPTSNGPPIPPEYDYLEANVLPDRVDVYFELFDEEHWNALQTAINNHKTEDEQRIKAQFGIRVSQRITFPALGGSRLP